MQNPTVIEQKLTNPIANGKKEKKKKKNRGNLPYIQFRRRERKTMFGKIM